MAANLKANHAIYLSGWTLKKTSAFLINALLGFHRQIHICLLSFRLRMPRNPSGHVSLFWCKQKHPPSAVRMGLNGGDWPFACERSTLLQAEQKASKKALESVGLARRLWLQLSPWQERPAERLCSSARL